MRNHLEPADMEHVTAGAIDRELQTIQSAIELVGSGQSSRVSLGGLRYAEQLLEHARAMAEERGVRIRELWPLGDGSPDLVVEPATPDDDDAGA